MVGIYKITNPEGKVYIGQAINIEKRKKHYARLGCKRQYKLFNSLKKYGWYQHVFEIIEECSIEQLDEKEIYYKQQFIDKQKWEMALFYYINDNNAMGPQSIETRLKKKKIALEKGFGKWNKGADHSKVGEHLKINNSKLKPVLQYDLKGIFIKEWISVNEAARTYKGVPNVLTGRSKTSGGFKWKFKE